MAGPILLIAMAVGPHRRHPPGDHIDPGADPHLRAEDRGDPHRPRALRGFLLDSLVSYTERLFSMISEHMIEALVTNIRLFLLVFFRIIAMVELAPLLSSSSIPQIAKVGLSLFLAAAVFPRVLASHYPIPAGIVDYGLLVLGEVAIGLLLGFLLNLIFSAFQLTGQFFSLQMWFSASEVFDPLSQVEIPSWGSSTLSQCSSSSRRRECRSSSSWG